MLDGDKLCVSDGDDVLGDRDAVTSREKDDVSDSDNVGLDDVTVQLHDNVIDADTVKEREAESDASFDGETVPPERL